MTERKSGPKKHWSVIAAVLAVACVIGGIVYYLNDMRGRETDPSVTPGVDETDDTVLTYNGRRYQLKEGLETVLIMGLDKLNDKLEGSLAGANYQQADFLLLLLIDEANETCVPLHINRDTMCNIWYLDIYGEPVSSFSGQITLAHAFGSGGRDSCRNQVRAVSELLLDSKIDHYISVTMDTVAKLNDMVGGVTVTVLDDFSREDPSLVQGETVTLHGDQALTYVRGRFNVGDATNLSRMARQQQYLMALLEKFIERMNGSQNFAMKALTEISDSMVSDCSIYQLSDIANAMTEYSFGEIRTIEGEAVKGEEFMEYYPDEEALMDLVIDLFYEPVEEEPRT